MPYFRDHVINVQRMSWPKGTLPVTEKDGSHSQMFFPLTTQGRNWCSKKRYTLWIILEKQGNTSVTEFIKPTA